MTQIFKSKCSINSSDTIEIDESYGDIVVVQCDSEGSTAVRVARKKARKAAKAILAATRKEKHSKTRYRCGCGGVFNHMDLYNQHEATCGGKPQETDFQKFAKLLDPSLHDIAGHLHGRYLELMEARKEIETHLLDAFIRNPVSPPDFTETIFKIARENCFATGIYPVVGHTYTITFESGDVLTTTNPNLSKDTMSALGRIKSVSAAPIYKIRAGILKP